MFRIVRPAYAQALLMTQRSSCRLLTGALIAFALPVVCEAGVMTLFEIDAGADSSSPIDMAVHNGYLYFAAEPFSNSRKQLYKHDGVTTNEVTLTDPNNGLGLRNFRHITPLGDHLYFRAATPGASGGSGQEPYKYSPATNGLVTWDGAISNLAPNSMFVHDGEVVMNAKFDTGVRRLAVIGADDSLTRIVEGDGVTAHSPRDYESLNGELYFTASSQGVHGRELFKFDGNNTFLVADIRPGTSTSGISDLTEYGGNLIFAANAGTHGTEIYQYDGTTVSLIQDVNTSGDSDPGDFVQYRDDLYFRATGDQGTELYKYDGSTVSRVTDLSPGAGSSNPTGMFVLNDELYFAADDAVNGNELFVYDAEDNSVRLVEDLNAGGGSNPDGFANYKRNLYFAAETAAAGRELYRYRPDSLKVRAEDYSLTASTSYSEFIRVGGAPGSRLEISGAGTVVSSGQGVTITAGGTVQVNAGASLTAAGNTTVARDGVLTGQGVIGNGVAAGSVTVSGSLAPGASPGTMVIDDNLTFTSSGIYDFEVNDFDGTAGLDPGWDRLNVTGTLDIDPGATLTVTSLTLANLEGEAANFDPTQSYSLLVATALGGINGNFTLDTSYFQNSLEGGSFALLKSSNNLYLTFVANSGSNGATPEPSSIFFLAAGLGGGYIQRRRSRRKRDASKIDSDETSVEVSEQET